jgi:hypothetical protein
LVFWNHEGSRDSFNVYNSYIVLATTKEQASRKAADHYYSDQSPSEEDIVEHMEGHGVLEMDLNALNADGVCYSYVN